MSSHSRTLAAEPSISGIKLCPCAPKRRARRCTSGCGPRFCTPVSPVYPTGRASWRRSRRGSGRDRCIKQRPCLATRWCGNFWRRFLEPVGGGCHRARARKVALTTEPAARVVIVGVATPKTWRADPRRIGHGLPRVALVAAQIIPRRKFGVIILAARLK